MRRKKFLTVGLVAFVACMLSGCLEDDHTEYAVANITTKSGKTFMFTSCYGREEAVNHKEYVNLKDEDDVAYIHFSCDDCGYDKKYEMKAPFSEVFECECEGRYKECIAIEGVISESITEMN